ncbi:MAG: hypothetical protein GXY13_16110, partial [Acidimicrobiales bacterium]|nr:hypothetical protein [Acidimicrobiales bacterium]
MFAEVFAQESLSQSTYEFEVNPVVSLFSIAFGGLVGFLIGRSKGRPVLGLILGALLGCFGWVIVALIPAKRNTHATAAQFAGYRPPPTPAYGPGAGGYGPPPGYGAQPGYGPPPGYGAQPGY